MLRPLAPPPSSPRLFESELTTPRSPRAWKGEGWAGLTVLSDNSAHPGLLPRGRPPHSRQNHLEATPTLPRLGSRPWASLHTGSPPPPCASTQPTATLAVRALHREGRSLRGVLASLARPHSHWAKRTAGSGCSPRVAQSGLRGAAARRRLPAPSDNGDPSGATTVVGVSQSGTHAPYCLLDSTRGLTPEACPAGRAPSPRQPRPQGVGTKPRLRPSHTQSAATPTHQPPQGPAAPPAVFQQGADPKTQPISSIPSPLLPAGSSKNPTPTCPVRAAWPH